MHTGRKYRLFEFVVWTRRSIYVLVLLSVVPALLYQGLGWRWLSIPWSVVFLLGTTVALSVGFKNLQTFNRNNDAQQVWSAIACASRVWGMVSRDLVEDAQRARSLMYRHLAWLTALRYEMRSARPWENTGKVQNREYKRYYRIAEHETPLESELAKYLPGEEIATILEAPNKAFAVLEMQDRATRSLAREGMLSAAGLAELQKLLRDFVDLQGRSERIKEFPYPRQYAFIHSLFVHVLCLFLPLGMMGEFDKLNAVVGGWAQGQMVWFGIPLSILISWMYISLDQVGESTENPFEGGPNDVPITHICRQAERDLRAMLNEPDSGLPAEGHERFVL